MLLTAGGLGSILDQGARILRVAAWCSKNKKKEKRERNLEKKKKIEGKERKKAKERVAALVKPVLRCGPEKGSWGELPQEDT